MITCGLGPKPHVHILDRSYNRFCRNDVFAKKIRPFQRLQITYWAGDFPPTLLDDFNSAATKHDKGQRPDHLYLGYHGHRCVFCGGGGLVFVCLIGVDRANWLTKEMTYG